jgi:hypothetical protein
LKKPVIILVLTACCSACANADKPRPESKAATAATDRHAICAGRMNAEHAMHGHGAPNWALYDYCMKHPD